MSRRPSPFRKRTDVCQPMDRSTLHPKEVCGLRYGSGRNGERETANRSKERLQSVPRNSRAKGGRTFLILLYLDVPGESLSWFHHGRDRAAEETRRGRELRTAIEIFAVHRIRLNGVENVSAFALYYSRCTAESPVKCSLLRIRGICSRSTCFFESYNKQFRGMRAL